MNPAPAPTSAYFVTQWDLYEKADTRKTVHMSWYAKQTKLVGLGIGKTLQQPYPQNMKLLGLWNMLETVASQSAPALRGWLVRDGRPLAPEQLAALLPTVPPEAFQEALDWFSHPDVNWIQKRPFLMRPSPGEVPGSLPASSPSPGEVPGSLPASSPSPGEVPGSLPAKSGVLKNAGKNPATDRQTDSTDRQTDIRERERTGGFATKGEARLAQRTQWAACNDRKKELEAIPEDERTEKQARDLERVRGLQKKIRRKQQRGDFTPVEEEAAK